MASERAACSWCPLPWAGAEVHQSHRACLTRPSPPKRSPTALVATRPPSLKPLAASAVAITNAAALGFRGLGLSAEDAQQIVALVRVHCFF